MKKYLTYVTECLSLLGRTSPLRMTLMVCMSLAASILATLTTLLPGQAVNLSSESESSRSLLIFAAIFSAFWLTSATLKALLLPVYGYLEQKAQTELASQSLYRSYGVQKNRHIRDNNEIAFAIDSQMAALRTTSSTVIFSVLPAICVMGTAGISLALIAEPLLAAVYLVGMILFISLSRNPVDKHQQAQGAFFGENMKNFGILTNYVNYWKETASFSLEDSNTASYAQSRKTVEESGILSYRVTKNLYLFQACVLFIIMASLLGVYLALGQGREYGTLLAGFISLTGVSLYSIQVIQDIGFSLSAIATAYAQDTEAQQKMSTSSSEEQPVPEKAPKNIDRKLPDKGLVWLLGSRGSGKTTYIETLLGFTPYPVPDHMSTRKFRETRYLPQETNLPFQTAHETIRASRPLETQNIDSCLQSLELDDFMTTGQRAQETIAGEESRVSGGEARRIGLARTLLGQPGSLIILDEPTTGIGRETQKIVWELVREKSLDNLILVITHDVDAPILEGDIVLKF